MSFFIKNQIPADLFTIFTSKYKDLYIDAVFVLLKCFRTEFSIRKPDLSAELCHAVEPYIETISGEDEEIAGKSLSEKAHAVIRRLVSDGWLRTEPNAITFEETYTVPDYAVKIIKVLHEIANAKPREYNSFVYSTYVSLQAANESRDEYLLEALLAAFRNTEELLDTLHSLHNNIRNFYQKIQVQTDIHQLMQEHFQNYQQQIVEKFYHRMKTTDCIPRFRTKILHILNRWLVDFELLDQLSAQMVQRGIHSTADESKVHIINMLTYMIDAYENVHMLLREIDKKNSNYIKASVERTQYLLTTEQSVKGQLVEILKRLPDYREEQNPVSEVLVDMLSIQRVTFADDKSFFMEPKRKEKLQPQRLEMETVVSQEQIDMEMDDIRKRAKLGVTRKKVIRYIENLMGDEGMLSTSNMLINGDEEFVQAIMSVIISDEKNIPYDVMHQEGTVLVNGYRIPNMTFTRKKERA